MRQVGRGDHDEVRGQGKTPVALPVVDVAVVVPVGATGVVVSFVAFLIAAVTAVIAAIAVTVAELTDNLISDDYK